MVKKLIGIFVAVAVVVIVVIAAIRRDNFRSMVLRDEALDQETPAAVQPVQPVAIPADTLTVEVTDSVTVEVTEPQ